MKKINALLVFVLFCSAVFAQADIDSEKESIREAITSAYQEGIANQGNVEAIKQGFHAGFNIIGLNNSDGLWKYPIYTWIESVEKRKENGEYPAKEKVSFKYPVIDVVGNAAMAKVEYYKSGKLQYTDYLSLYKINDNWKIVSKVYFKH